VINHLSRKVISSALVLLPSLLFCVVDQEEKKIQDETSVECSKSVLLSYFPKEFVVETLKKFKVPKEKWEEINKKLAEKDSKVIDLVQEKASEIDPNLLKDPQKRQVAVKIFRETLLNIFSEVMKANGIQDPKQIEGMLDDIQQQKAQRFAQCMRLNKNPFDSNLKKSNYTQEKNNEEDDEGDDDDDEEDEEEFDFEEEKNNNRVNDEKNKLKNLDKKASK